MSTLNQDMQDEFDKKIRKHILSNKDKDIHQQIYLIIQTICHQELSRLLYKNNPHKFSAYIQLDRNTNIKLPIIIYNK